MKKIILFTFLFALTSMASAKEIYFYMNRFPGTAKIKVKIFNKSEKIGEIRENSWLSVNVGNVSNFEITTKSGAYFSSKKITVDFSNKEVAFIKIDLGAWSWEIYETTLSNVPETVAKEFSSRLNIITNTENEKFTRTNWTETALKDYLTGESVKEFEGIYENSFKTINSSKYIVGVKYIDDLLHIIYLSGSENNYWHEGETKAILKPTATKNLFKVNWLMSDKSQNEELLIYFEKGQMKIVWGDGNSNLYIKLFPVFEIENNNKRYGTGFAISSNGFIVTNYHVTQGAKKISVRGINSNFSILYSAHIIAEDKNNDLAIIKVDDLYSINLGKIPYYIENSLSETGTSVFTLGYPLTSTMGNEIKLAHGIISSKSGFKGDVTTYQVSVPVQPGNSGGPLLDSKGKLIGVINSKHLDAENVSYAIKSVYLHNLILSLETQPVLPNINLISNLLLTEQAEAIKKFVYILEVN